MIGKRNNMIGKRNKPGREKPSTKSVPYKPMRIAVVGTRGIPGVQGGVETYCENLYPLLVDQGCEITVYTRAHYVDNSMASFQGVRLVHLRCLRQKYIEAALHTLVAVIHARCHGQDIIHFQAVGPCIFVPLAKLLGMKTVVRHVGPDYERKKWGRFARTILRFGESCAVSSADAITCLTPHIEGLIRKRFLRRDLQIIPNATPIVSPLESSDILQKHSLQKTKYILSVGRFVPEKGLHILIRAFQKSMGQSGWKLVLTGDSTFKGKYKQELYRHLGEDPHVVLTGVLKGRPLAELYSHAGLFVLPSFHEGMSFSLLEALSYGLPCLVSDIPSNRALDIEMTRYFKVGSVEHLAEQLVQHSLTPYTAERRTKQIEWIRRDYQWKCVAKSMLAVFRGVIEA